MLYSRCPWLFFYWLVFGVNLCGSINLGLSKMFWVIILDILVWVGIYLKKNQFRNVWTQIPLKYSLRFFLQFDLPVFLCVLDSFSIWKCWTVEAHQHVWYGKNCEHRRPTSRRSCQISHSIIHPSRFGFSLFLPCCWSSILSSILSFSPVFFFGGFFAYF